MDKGDSNTALNHLILFNSIHIHRDYSQLSVFPPCSWTSHSCPTGFSPGLNDLQGPPWWTQDGPHNLVRQKRKCRWKWCCKKFKSQHVAHGVCVLSTRTMNHVSERGAAWIWALSEDRTTANSDGCRVKTRNKPLLEQTSGISHCDLTYLH